MYHSGFYGKRSAASSSSTLDGADQRLSGNIAGVRPESPGETKVVEGEKNVESLAYAFVERAAASSYLVALADNRIPKETEPAIAYMRQMFERNPDLKFQLVADLQDGNVGYYKAVMEAGVEIRHIEGNKVSFALSKAEYLAAPLSAIEEQASSGAPIPREVVWSTRQDVVSQADQIFQVMWKSAIPADARIRQLEEGVEPEATLIINDMKKVYELGKKMTEECSEEVLMVLASQKTILRNKESFQSLADRQRRLGFPIRILAPTVDRSVTELLPDATWRSMDKSINVSILIYDRSRMFITQYSNSDAETTEQAVSTNIYSTSKPTIAGLVSVFEALWGETELREKEERSRKQAQLLQDVLTHDIRNYNQIIRFNSDLLGVEPDGPKRERLLSMMTSAIEGSTSLIERAKKLGKITSEENVQLRPINVKESLDRSLALVMHANPGRHIEYSYSSDGPDAQAICDELLDEAFVNILSNSVRYTKGDRVSIDVQVEKFDTDGEEMGGVETKRHYWKIRVTDHGVGVPDEVKEKAFRRYLDSAMGSGLGLSIVRALVVERYAGNVMIKDRVQGLRSEGTVVEIWLQRQS
jgi:two-component system sensor histidine kinase VicK